MQVFRSGIAHFLLESLPSCEEQRTEKSDAKEKKDTRLYEHKDESTVTISLGV